jgi:hypothetical protein
MPAIPLPEPLTDRMYTIITTVGNGQMPPPHLYACPDCGAAVFDSEGIVTHDRWHVWIERHGTIGAIWALRNGHDRRPLVR